MTFSINQDGDEAIYNYRSIPGTDADNIYIASIYLNKYFDKRLARTAPHIVTGKQEIRSWVDIALDAGVRQK